MGTEGNKKEARRWFEQAEDDLAAAIILRENNKCAQACFYCQQASEKALKACWYFFGLDPWGHSILRLMENLETEELNQEFRTLHDHARILDRFYIPTRYPNGLPELIPSDAYGLNDAEQGIQLTKEIVERVQGMIKI